MLQHISLMAMVGQLQSACALLAVFSLVIAAAPAHQSRVGPPATATRDVTARYDGNARSHTSRKHVQRSLRMSLKLSDGREVELEDDIKSSLYTTLMQELVHLAVDSEEFRKILSGNAEICSLAIDMMDCRDTVVNQNSSKQDSPSNKEESGSGSPSNEEESGSGSPSNKEESGSGSPSNKEESGSGSPSNKEESGSGSPSNKEESGSGSPSNKEESGSDDPSNKEESGSGISPQSATEAISTHTPALREKVNQLFTLEQVLDAMEKAISKLDRDKAHNMPAAKEAGISEQPPQSLTTPTLWARPSKPTNTPTLATTPPSTSTPPATPSTTPTSHMPQAVVTNDSLTVGNENEADILDLIEKTLQLMERVNNRNGTDRSGDAMTSSSETTSMEKTAEMYKSDVPKPTVASSLPTDATDSSTEMMVNGQEMIDEIRDALDRIRRTDG